MRDRFRSMQKLAYSRLAKITLAATLAATPMLVTGCLGNGGGSSGGNNGGTNPNPTPTPDPNPVVNQAPVFTSDAPKSAWENHKLEYQITATDDGLPADSSLEYTLMEGPSGSSLDPNGLFRWDVPEVSANDSAYARFKVSDGEKADYQDMNLTILDIPSDGEMADPNIGVNNAPLVRSIYADFGDGLSGEFTIVAKAEDLDEGDYAKTASLLFKEYNGNIRQYFNDINKLNPWTLETSKLPILPGDNTLEFTARDSAGAKATREISIYSPTEEEARNLIRPMLEATDNGGMTEDDSILGNSVDWTIEAGSGNCPNIAIEYISHIDNLEEKMAARDFFSSNGWPVFYVHKIPLDEIESRLTYFINNSQNDSGDYCFD